MFRLFANQGNTTCIVDQWKKSKKMETKKKKLEKMWAADSKVS